jgi:Penicillin binding protein transpeptidase domain/Penicillin-binding Protein dimerisation domain/NTF2-like N-terminal transpeptidase domain
MTGSSTGSGGGAGREGGDPARPPGSAWTLEGPWITSDAAGGTATRLAQSKRPRRPCRPRGVIAFVLAIVLLAVAAIAAGSYVLLRTRGSPGETAGRYLSAWQRGNVAAMRELSVGVPAGGLAGPLAQVDRDLGVRSKDLRLGAVTSGGSGTARAAFTATLTLAGGVRWTYQGKLQLLHRSRHWWVNWSPAAIYPALTQGERFRVTAVWPARAAVLGAGGTRLDSPQATAESGSIQMLTGMTAAATASQLKKLGPPYRPGDLVGQSGIEQAYERRLAGAPRTSIELVAGGRVAATVANFGGRAGTPVRTSIDMHVQQAASRAVATVTGFNVAMVAIRPSTGDVLAVVNKPGGFNRALEGTYPPGSTFKMITASALAVTGMRSHDTVQCPAKINIGGRSFHNFDFEQLGTTNLLTAFAVSCNTTFADLAAQRLGGGRLGAMASNFGFGVTPHLGIPAVLGTYTAPADSTQLAANGFGQGTDLVNPLEMATVAGAIDNGAWRSPRLVTNPALPHSAPRPLGPEITATLRPMMAAVVSIGTAANVGFPPGVFGKTGTAEFGSGPNPPSHAWFAGYRGDLAFAVIVEGGGTGADKAGPVANAFLRGL